MTDERVIELRHLVDDFNACVNASASLQIAKDEERIHVSMFYCNSCHVFSNYKYHSPDYNSTKDTENLDKAEAFMRMLISSALYYDPMEGRTL